MPIIPSYTAPGATSIIHPSEVGEQALVRSGRMEEQNARVTGALRAQSIGDFAQPIAAAGRASKEVLDIIGEHQIQMDKSEKAVEIAAKHNQAVRDLNTFAAQADPNHPEVIQDYLTNSILPRFQDTTGYRTTQGQAWGQERTLAVTEHLQNMVTADIGSMGFAAATQNLDKLGEISVDTVAHDPSAVHTTVDHYRASAEAAGARVSPQHKAAYLNATEEHVSKIGRSALAASLQADPSGTERLFRQGYWDNLNVPAGEITTAIAQAKRMKVEDAQRAMILDKMQREQVSQNALGGWMKQHMVQLPNGRMGFDDSAASGLIGLKGLLPGHALEALNSVNRSTDESLRPMNNPELNERLIHMVENHDPNAENALNLAVAGKQIDTTMHAGLMAIAKSGIADSLERDPGLKSVWDSAQQTIMSNIGGPRFSGLSGLSDPQDRLAFQAAKIELLSRLATMTPQEKVQALDPTTTNTLLSADNLRRWKLLAAHFVGYGGSTSGAQPPGTPAPGTTGEPVKPTPTDFTPPGWRK